MPEKFAPVSIPNAVIEPLINSWRVQAELYHEYIPLLPVNQIRTVHEYNQKKDRSCVIVSAAGMITYNTGVLFTNEELHEMWQEYQGNFGGSIFKTTKQMAQRFLFDSFPIDMYSPDLDLILSKRYAVQITLWCGADVFLDGVKDGVMDGVYTMIRDLQEDVLKHAIFMYQTDDGEVWLQNSWPDGSPKNIYNCTKVYKQMIEKQLIRQCGMIVLPFSQDITPGMKNTMKYYTRCLTRAGIAIVGDLFTEFKRKYAKLDGVIDPQYRIK